MLERDIRSMVRAALSEFTGEDGVMVNEFPLAPWGEARADLAVLDLESWHGYEIKSPADSLARLPRQVVSYGRIFDFCTLIAASCHVQRAADLLPDWWGLCELTADDRLAPVRAAAQNPSPDAVAIAAILRKHEANIVLVHAGVPVELHRGRRKARTLAAARLLPLPVMRRAIRQAFILRGA